MKESPGARKPSGDGRLSFRRRSADEAADIHQEGRRLIEEARAARKQWLAAHADARMTLVQREIVRVHLLEGPDESARDANRSLQEEREAHGLSKHALERELARSRKLEDEVLSVQDQERTRLARDLHDGIAQNLVAVSLLLEMHLRQLQELGPDSRSMRSGLKLSEILQQTTEEMRGLSHGLSGLETGARGESLRAALHTLAARLNASERARCVVVCPERPALGGINAPHLYRIAQEAVGNAVRHGKAEHIEIALARARGRWRFTVTDDGIGLPEKGASGGGGLGMRSMKYRAAVIGGVLTLRRAKATGDRPGTVVGCTFP